MQWNFHLVPILSLVTGILILVSPRLLNYAVGVYLVLIGVLGITGIGRL